MKYIIILSLTILSLPVLAQEVNQITFSEAVNIALRNNTTLEQAENQQLVNQALKKSGVASMGPSLSANASGYRLVGNQFIEQEGTSINDAETDNFSASFSAELVLFSGLDRQYRLSSSKASYEGQMFTIKRTRQDVIRDVANQYLQVLLDIELLNIARENLETQETQLDQIRQMVELGSKAEVEKFTQEATVKQAELRLLRAKNTLMNDKMALAQLLLLDPEVSFELVAPEWELDDMIASAPFEEDLTSRALENRGDYKASIYNEKAERLNFKSAKSNYFPTIAAYFATGSFYTTALTPEFTDQFDRGLRTQYGLSMSIPIFNGLERYSNSVQAKVQHLNAELQTKELNNRVKTEVIAAVQNYRDAVLNYRAAESSLEASTLSFALEEERFNLGVTDLVQYAQANQNMVQAKSDYAQAYFTLAFQDILMKYALGTLTPEDIPN